MFVIGTDTKKNIVYVGEGQYHPGLYRKQLFVKDNDIHIISPIFGSYIYANQKMKARIRYRQQLQDVDVSLMNGGLFVKFDEEQRGITSGQFVAFYIDDELVASGVIS
jgi:tRNA-specific 2-thiouridylase